MYKKDKKGWGKHIDFILLDVVCILIGYLLAYTICTYNDLSQMSNMYIENILIYVLVDIGIVLCGQSYKNILKRGYLDELIAVIKHVSFIYLITLLIMFYMKNSGDYSKKIFLLSWGISIAFSYIGRIIWKSLLYKKCNSSSLRKIVIYISEGNVNDIINRINEKKFVDFTIIAIFVTDRSKIGNDIGGVPVYEIKQGIVNFISNNVVDEILFFVTDKSNKIKELSDNCINMGVTVHVNVMWELDAIGESIINSVAGFNVITKSIKIATTREVFVKRVIDIIGAFVGLIITLLISVIVAPIIYIQSPGPIIFAQNRVGKNGRIFKVYKFRSMYMDAEERKKELMSHNEMSGLMFKMKNDPRIFPFGRFIRKTSIDELPQLFNVLKGDMSLVGTRPPTVDEYKQYESRHYKRLAIKPGLTGLWQVSGRSDIKDFEEVVNLDTQYITNFSILLDIKIIFKTVAVVFGKSGAE